MRVILFIDADSDGWRIELPEEIGNLSVNCRLTGSNSHISHSLFWQTVLFIVSPFYFLKLSYYITYNQMLGNTT